MGRAVGGCHLVFSIVSLSGKVNLELLRLLNYSLFLSQPGQVEAEKRWADKQRLSRGGNAVNFLPSHDSFF